MGRQVSPLGLSFINFIMQSQTPLHPCLNLPSSPLSKCDPSLQAYFASLPVPPSALPPLPCPFEAVPSPKPICTRVLPPGSIYFVSGYFSYQHAYNDMVYCSDCFDKKTCSEPYEERVVKTQSVSCDCGRVFRHKENQMCKQHDHRVKQIQPHEDGLPEFKQFYRQVYKIVMYIRANREDQLPVAKLACQSLQKLCRDSLHYCSLAGQFIKDEPELDLLEFMLQHSFCHELLMHLLADVPFKLFFGEYFVRKEQEDVLSTIRYTRFRDELLESPQFLAHMLDKGIVFPEVMGKYLRMLHRESSCQKTRQQLQNLLGNLVKNVSVEEYLEIISQVLTHDSDMVLREGGIDIVGHMLEMATEECISEGSRISERGSKIYDIIRKIILSSCGDDIEKLPQVLARIYQIEGARQKLWAIIDRLYSEMSRLQFVKYLRQKNRPRILVSLYIIATIEDQQKRHRINQKIWSNVLQTDGVFIDEVEHVYDLISFFCNSYMTYPSLGLNRQDREAMLGTATVAQIKDRLFQQYLVGLRSVSKRYIWDDYIDGWLAGTDCTSTLFKHTRFVEEQETFKYTGAQECTNQIMKIHLARENKQWDRIKLLGIDYNSKYIGENELLTRIFVSLFSTPHFFEKYYACFMASLEKAERDSTTLQRWKKKGVGQVYLILLLLIDKVCHGQEDEKIREEIEKIKINLDEYRFKFLFVGDEQQIIKLLCEKNQAEEPVEVEVVQEGMVRSPEELAAEELKAKSQSKKEKMQAKINAQRQKMLEKLDVPQNSAPCEEEQEQNFCLCCKEREKKDKQFVFLAHLSEGNTISRILHGEQSATSIRLKTNLHAVHLKCFQETKKKQMGFQCPLCKQDVNCFVPYRPNKVSKKVLQMCWNVINAVLVYKHEKYDTGNFFQVMLEGIVESLGFAELIVAKKSKSIIKQKQRCDKYILDMLICLYSFAPAAQQEKYLESFTVLRERIQSCNRQEIKLFQTVILEACFTRITGRGDMNVEIIEALAQIMVEDELVILRCALEFIYEGNLEITSLDEIMLSMDKIKDEGLQSQGQITEPTSLEHIEESAVQGSGTLSPTKRAYQGTRISLGMNIFELPETLKELLDPGFIKRRKRMQGELKCQCSGNKIDVICLICHRLFCRTCIDDKEHNKIHKDYALNLTLRTGQLELRSESNNQKFDIYYNQFMISYRKARSEVDEAISDRKAREDERETLLTDLAYYEIGSNRRLSKDKDPLNYEDFRLKKSELAKAVDKIYNYD